MKKKRELTDSTSCISKALDDEMIFVLLGRDDCAVAAIHAWIKARVKAKRNLMNDEQILEAISCADQMERERDAIRKRIAKAPKTKRRVSPMDALRAAFVGCMSAADPPLARFDGEQMTAMVRMFASGFNAGSTALTSATPREHIEFACAEVFKDDFHADRSWDWREERKIS